MRISRILVTTLALIAVVGLASGPVFSEDTSSEKMNVRVLYAGHPDSAREKDFVTFLRHHFSIVQRGNLAKFRSTDAKDFDVVILDYDGDGFKAPRVRLPRTYTRPTVTVGVVGAFICGQIGLKTGYL